MDPEDVAAFLQPYQARLQEELDRFGGTVEKFIGDAIMALFGAPVAHEDDPERAVRAALAIRDWAAEEGIELRVGITTGEALVALGAKPTEGQPMATGDAVNTSARLQTAAPVGGILVDEHTYHATELAIGYVEAELVQAKGKAEPVAAWRPLSARSRMTGRAVHDATLVGRQRELELLASALERTREERSSELVTVVGVPGIGKSRLVLELFERIEQEPNLTSWRQGRCLPYGDGVTFWALGEMVKGQVGILEDDDQATTEGKLNAAVDDAWLKLHLRPLVGLPGGAASGGERREEAFTAWRRYFEELAEQHPLVLVFEDLHWADDSLLDFIDHLVDWTSGAPLLVLCTTRPELLTRRPSWGGGKSNALTVSLSPLTDEQTARLLAELLRRSGLPVETQAELLDRCAGNPLYAEEYARTLRQRGHIGQLPETLQGMIAARIDLLDLEHKALLQDAAVVGKTFWLRALVTLGNTDSIGARLHVLERDQFVRCERTTSMADEIEYSFRHVLMRDVAYSQIPRAERAEKHRRTAEWIETLGRREDHAEMLAHHYLQALELGAAAGIDTTPFAAAAGAALEDAGDRAFALNAFDAAARYYREALDMSADTELRGQLLLRLGRAREAAGKADTEVFEEARDALLGAGDPAGAGEVEATLAVVYSHLGNGDLSFRHLARARELVYGLPPSPAKARIIQTAAGRMMVAHENEEAIRLGHEALQMAEQLGLDDVRAAALNAIGMARCNRGDYGGLADLESAIAVADRAKAISPFIVAKGNLATVLVMRGELREASRIQAEAAGAADRFGHLGRVRWYRGMQVAYEYLLGEWDAALAGSEQFLAEVEAGSPHILATASYGVRSLIRLARGENQRSVADIEQAIVLARQGKDPTVDYAMLAFGAHVFRETGNAGRAGAMADEVLKAIQVGPGLRESVWTHMLARAFAELGRGNELASELTHLDSPWAKAGAAFVAGDPITAAEICAGMGAIADEAYDRLAAARAGDLSQLERALAFYRSVGAARYVREAEALLAATA
jgi:tetratricopeptide (TPR) repeat protein